MVNYVTTIAGKTRQTFPNVFSFLSLRLDSIQFSFTFSVGGETVRNIQKVFDGNFASIVLFVAEPRLKVQLIMLKYKYCRTSATPEPSPRSLSNHNSPGHSFKGSTSSLSSSTDGMSLRRRKKKPAPPPPVVKVEEPSAAIMVRRSINQPFPNE